MSYRQCIWIAYPVDIPRYLHVLQTEYGAQPHPNEPGGYLIGEPALPFLAPRLLEDQLTITGFNRIPLSSLLVQALAIHPEMAPPTTPVRWIEEQELVVRGTLEQLGRQLRGKER